MSFSSSATNEAERFQFGQNWRNYLSLVDQTKIDAAKQSLCDMLELSSLAGLRFLDLGSGSGIFSLAAHQLGAKVTSFDFDPNSVECCEILKQKYAPNQKSWTVLRGSILDTEFLNKLERYEIVYAWGVLHHTGHLWSALQNASDLVAPRGKIFLSIYNDQNWLSHYWLNIKRLYNKNFILKLIIIALHAPYLIGIRYLFRLLRGQAHLERGMSLWHDMLDWLGGYPFEVATPEAIFSFLKERGFILLKLKTCAGRHGCNEFVLQRTPELQHNE